MALPGTRPYGMNLHIGETSCLVQRRGYTPFEYEMLNPDEQKSPDTKEGIYIGREVAADSEEAQKPLHGPNQWPNPVRSCLNAPKLYTVIVALVYTLPSLAIMYVLRSPSYSAADYHRVCIAVAFRGHLLLPNPVYARHSELGAGLEVFKGSLTSRTFYTASISIPNIHLHPGEMVADLLTPHDLISQEPVECPMFDLHLPTQSGRLSSERCP